MEQRVLFYCLLLICAFLGYSHCQSASDCKSLTNCHTCIGTATCTWCSDENFSSERCDTLAELAKLDCKNISNPSSKETPTQNDALGAGVQVQPQKIRLDLRSGEPAKFTLSVQPAKNYPVDLYYLMDMSLSMEDDLGNLKALAGKIANAMQNITTNYKLGFGSFVDKTVSPFIRTETKLPCDVGEKCDPAYGFKNVLALVKNPALFQTKVDAQIISGNLDVPEGGFDALMQVAVCEKEIGWSKKSRRLVVFVTDESFHIAGDGKLGGIVTPNDGKCHLDSNGYYAKSNELDYPSLSQLHEKLQDSNILPIFAVTKDFTSLYQSVSSMWSDLGAVTGELAKDSGNVVDLIKNKYEEIVSTVSLVYKEPEKISVDVKAKCGDNSVSGQNKKCSNVKLGQKVTFDISVKLEECPKSKDDMQKSFSIHVPGFGSVTLDLSYICECQCEQPHMKEHNSSKCSDGNGTLACGICECNKGRYGEICQCDSPFDKTKDQSKCKSANSSDDLLCSGRGECACGKCVCRSEQGKRFYGELCQCNDFSCPQDNGQLCGGPEHGVCRCRKCHCKDKYSGDVCNIKNCNYFPPETQCKKDANSDVCGGPERGKCVSDPENCHKCVCNKKYDGTYCENCPYCEDGMCRRNEDCAKCSTFEGKSLDECKKAKRCEDNVREVEVLSDIKEKTDEGLYQCEAVDSKDSCTYYFTTQTEQNKESFKLYVQKDKVNCPKEAPIVAIIAGVIGGIVLLGLLILILVKVFLTMVDRIEYQKFERAQMQSRWTKEKNPLYQAAKTTFENPTYAGGRPS